MRGEIILLFFCCCKIAAKEKISLKSYINGFKSDFIRVFYAFGLHKMSF
jgi:hypothetical protein